MVKPASGATPITKTDDIISYTLRNELPKITFEAGVMYK
jgi:hypothetical protein